MKIFNKNSVYALFIISLLTLEFYYINVGGGVARPYNFLATVVILLLIGSIFQVLKSRIFIALLVFYFVNIIASILSGTPNKAFASFASYSANIGIVIAVALILLRCKLSLEQFSKLVLVVTVASVIFGLVQVFAYRFGINLALSEPQLVQLNMGFGPAFRTEANTFGKYLVFPFLLFLPAYLHNQQDKFLRICYSVMLIGIFASFTRTAIFGLLAAMAFVMVWYPLRGKASLVSTRLIKIFMVAGISIGLLLSGVVTVGDYATHKMENIFNKQELLSGGSSAYRLEAMQAVIDVTLNDIKRFWIGNGWGQTYVRVRREEVQAGGADMVNILGYSGFIGVVFYLLYTFTMMHKLARIARTHREGELARFAEGLLFASIGMFVTGLMSGYLIAPEYYILLGASIFADIACRRRLSAQMVRR